MNDTTRLDATQRLASAAGHIRGIERMVADDAYCIDVIKQIQAVQAALSKVSTILLDNHDAIFQRQLPLRNDPPRVQKSSRHGAIVCAGSAVGNSSARGCDHSSIWSMIRCASSGWSSNRASR